MSHALRVEKDERNPYFVAVGERIARAREAKELTQTELAAALVGVSQQKLWNWENGIALFPPAQSDQLQRVLGIDANYLYQDRWDSLPVDVLKRIGDVGRTRKPVAPQTPWPPRPRRPRLMHKK